MTIKKLLNITSSERFLEMNQSSQALFFHFVYRTEDIESISNYQSLIRGLKYGEGNVKELEDNEFLIKNGNTLFIK